MQEPPVLSLSNMKLNYEQKNFTLRGFFPLNNILTEVTFNAVLGLCGKVLIVGGLHGWPLSEEARGCPVLDAAGSSWLHNRAAVPISKAGGTSVITYLTKGKTLHNSEERRGGKKCKKQSCGD